VRVFFIILILLIINIALSRLKLKIIHYNPFNQRFISSRSNMHFSKQIISLFNTSPASYSFIKTQIAQNNSRWSRNSILTMNKHHQLFIIPHIIQVLRRCKNTHWNLSFVQIVDWEMQDSLYPNLIVLQQLLLPNATLHILQCLQIKHRSNI